MASGRVTDLGSSVPQPVCEPSTMAVPETSPVTSRSLAARISTGSTWLLLAVLAAGLMVRLLFASVTPMFFEGDSQSYLLPGWELSHGGGFTPELRRAPLYPMFIAASMLLLGESLDRLALAQQLLGLVTVALTFLIGRRLSGTLVGGLAGLAIAFSGPQLIYERYLMTEVLFGFLLAATTLLMLIAVQKPTPLRL